MVSGEMVPEPRPLCTILLLAGGYCAHGNGMVTAEHYPFSLRHLFVMIGKYILYPNVYNQSKGTERLPLCRMP